MTPPACSEVTITSRPTSGTRREDAGRQDEQRGGRCARPSRCGREAPPCRRAPARRRRIRAIATMGIEAETSASTWVGVGPGAKRCATLLPIESSAKPAKRNAAALCREERPECRAPVGTKSRSIRRSIENRYSATVSPASAVATTAHVAPAARARLESPEDASSMRDAPPRTQSRAVLARMADHPGKTSAQLRRRPPPRGEDDQAEEGDQSARESRAVREARLAATASYVRGNFRRQPSWHASSSPPRRQISPQPELRQLGRRSCVQPLRSERSRLR